jgi:hypothetical protein
MEQELTLQQRRHNEVSMHFWATLREDGSFTLNGLDLGVGPSNGDFEYEWIVTVKAEDLPALRVLLDCQDGEDLFDVLRRVWLPVEGAGLEKLIRDSTVPSEFWCWRS